MSAITKDGFTYKFDSSACDSCGGRCCTGESGNIFVKSDEIHAISKFLNISLEEFIKNYLVKKGYRYSVKEKRRGNLFDCLFFSAELKQCTIYEVRPKQCRTFPFWDYYKRRTKELQEECSGVVV